MEKPNSLHNVHFVMQIDVVAPVRAIVLQIRYNWEGKSLNDVSTNAIVCAYICNSSSISIVQNVSIDIMLQKLKTKNNQTMDG